MFSDRKSLDPHMWSYRTKQCYLRHFARDSSKLLNSFAAFLENIDEYSRDPPEELRARLGRMQDLIGKRAVTKTQESWTTSGGWLQPHARCAVSSTLKTLTPAWVQLGYGPGTESVSSTAVSLPLSFDPTGTLIKWSARVIYMGSCKERDGPRRSRLLELSYFGDRMSHNLQGPRRDPLLTGPAIVHGSPSLETGAVDGLLSIDDPQEEIAKEGQGLSLDPSSGL